MNIQEIERKAVQLKERLEGKIFVSPIDESESFSKYVITMDVGGGQFKTYPEPLTINEAAACVLELLEGLKGEGFNVDYSRDVRFITYEAQMNAPDVTMRRLKKSNVDKPLFVDGVDIVSNPDDPEEILFSARGIVKFSVLEMLDKNQKGIQFMNEYFKLLASRRYGKTAAAIKQEVRRMSKSEAIRWVERTYERYISDSKEVMNIMLLMGGANS